MKIKLRVSEKEAKKITALWYVLGSGPIADVDEVFGGIVDRFDPAGDMYGFYEVYGRLTGDCIEDFSLGLRKVKK